MDDQTQNPQSHAPNGDEELSATSPANGIPLTRDYKLQAEEYLAGWKRAQADYQNLKKEVEREKGEYAKYANERFVESLLPAIDQYDVALSHTPDISHVSEDTQKKLTNWITGLQAVRTVWQNSFKNIGLESVEPVKGDVFDPYVHEAVGHEHSTEEGYEDGQISRCMNKGWRLHGKLLRPAKVAVIDNKSDTNFVAYGPTFKDNTILP